MSTVSAREPLGVSVTCIGKQRGASEGFLSESFMKYDS